MNEELHAGEELNDTTLENQEGDCWQVGTDDPCEQNLEATA